jgi:apolipoprotein N-acyltransferase
MNSNVQNCFPKNDAMSWLWLVLGAALLPFSLLQTVIPVAAWLAPIFLLRFVRTLQKRIALPLIIIVYQAALAIALRNGYFPVTFPALACIVLVVGAVLSLGYVADRLLAPLTPQWAHSLVFPVTAVSIDFLIAEASPFATWFSPAYAHFGNMAFIQIVSITGIYGLTFLVAWLAAVINEIWQKGFTRRTECSLGITVASVLLINLLLGGARVAFFPSGSTAVRVAALTPVPVKCPYPSELARGGPAMRETLWVQSEKILENLLIRTSKESRSGARLVVWSEAAVVVPEEKLPEALKSIKDIARKERIYLLAGIALSLRSDRFPFIRNMALFVNPQGDVEIEYDKSHPVFVSPWDAAAPGPQVVPTSDTPFGRLGIVICFDADFPRLVRQAGRAGVDILLVPAFDSDAIRFWHAQMAVFRAVENGLSIVRPACNGISIAADYQGRVLGRATDSPAGSSDLAVAVPTKGRTTLYPIIGDGFAWTCMIVLVMMIGRALLFMKRKMRESQ